VLANGSALNDADVLDVAGLFGRLDSELDLAELRRHWLFLTRLDTRRLRELSPREQEVFLLLGFALSNRSISHVLGVTERTVKAHVGRVLAKLMLESRLQAGLAAFALLTGGAPNVPPPRRPVSHGGGLSSGDHSQQLCHMIQILSFIPGTPHRSCLGLSIDQRTRPGPRPV
jgi:DNA-binding CsgD family transcriptional regulator